MSEAYKRISKGLKEAIEYSKGNTKEAKELKPKDIDVKKLRERIGMS